MGSRGGGTRAPRRRDGDSDGGQAGAATALSTDNGAREGGAGRSREKGGASLLSFPRGTLVAIHSSSFSVSRGPHPLPLAALEKLGVQTYCSSWPTRGGGP